MWMLFLYLNFLSKVCAQSACGIQPWSSWGACEGCGTGRKTRTKTCNDCPSTNWDCGFAWEDEYQGAYCVPEPCNATFTQCQTVSGKLCTWGFVYEDVARDYCVQDADMVMGCATSINVHGYVPATFEQCNMNTCPHWQQFTESKMENAVVEGLIMESFGSKIYVAYKAIGKIYVKCVEASGSWSIIHSEDANEWDEGFRGVLHVVSDDLIIFLWSGSTYNGGSAWIRYITPDEVSEQAVNMDGVTSISPQSLDVLYNDDVVYVSYMDGFTTTPSLNIQPYTVSVMNAGTDYEYIFLQGTDPIVVPSSVVSDPTAALPTKMFLNDDKISLFYIDSGSSSTFLATFDIATLAFNTQITTIGEFTYNKIIQDGNGAYVFVTNQGIKKYEDSLVDMNYNLPSGSTYIFDCSSDGTMYASVSGDTFMYQLSSDQWVIYADYESNQNPKPAFPPYWHNDPSTITLTDLFISSDDPGIFYMYSGEPYFVQPFFYRPPTNVPSASPVTSTTPPRSSVVPPYQALRNSFCGSGYSSLTRMTYSQIYSTDECWELCWGTPDCFSAVWYPGISTCGDNCNNEVTNACYQCEELMTASTVSEETTFGTVVLIPCDGDCQSSAYSVSFFGLSLILAMLV